MTRDSPDTSSSAAGADTVDTTAETPEPFDEDELAALAQ